MMADMMPQMMEKMGPGGMAGMMREMMPRMMEGMGPEGMAGMMPAMMEMMGAEHVEKMVLDMMPKMMDSCFSGVDMERRQFMLTHCRGMLDAMEAKYVSPPQPA